MNIACVGSGWYPQEPGGLEKYVYGMTHALLEDGDRVDLFVTGTPELGGPNGHAYSIGVPGEPLLKRMRDARRTFARSFRGPYDVLNLHFAMNALPLIPFISHAIPRVVHFHGPWAAESRAEGGGALSVSIKATLEKYVYRSADRFIVLSTAFKEILTGYGIAADRIFVIPMGIDTNFFSPGDGRAAARAHFGWPQDAKIFFTARRLVNRVGLQELLEAARIVRARHSGALIKIAGKGPLRAELERLIAQYDLGDAVELLGFVSEEQLVLAYRAADATLLPSQALEGFGTIISESLACGTPAIVTPVGGMPEAIAPLDRDLIARSATPNDIAERMTAVLESTLSLPERDVCRRYAVENYEWKVVVRRIRSVFGDL